MDDLFLFDPISVAWIAIVTTPTNGNEKIARGLPPTPRAEHGFAETNGKLYVHGGLSYFGVHTFNFFFFCLKM